MLDAKLLRDGSKFFVAVSGGIDSMALLFCLKEIQSYGYSFSLQAIHINHGTRAEQIQEEELVRRYCHELNIELHVAKLSGLDANRNFEFEARKKRYEAMRSLTAPGDSLVLGHHIDDSFEWTLLQNLRSSSLEGSLGIPARNGAVVRPFMCVTKAQIKRYIDAHDLPFLEDPTNEHTRYERNYIRAQISEGFAERYPKYLKHYVHRQNELARRLGKHVSLKDQSDFKIFYGEGRAEIISFNGEFNPSGLEFRILQAMNFLLPNGRGSLSSQIAKIIQAMKNHKSGPFTLSKGVLVYLSHNHLLLCRPSYIGDSTDEAFASSFLDEENKYLFKEFTYEQYLRLLKELYRSQKVRHVWPLWVVVGHRRFNIERSKKHPLWPKLHRSAAQSKQGELIAAIKLLKYWAKPKNRSKRLSLRLLLSL